MSGVQFFREIFDKTNFERRLKLISRELSKTLYLGLINQQFQSRFKQHKLTWVGETQKRETRYFYPTIEHNTDYFKSFTLNEVRHLVGGGSGGGSGDDGKYLRHYTLANSINEIGLGVCGYQQQEPLPWSISNADVISFFDTTITSNVMFLFQIP